MKENFEIDIFEQDIIDVAGILNRTANVLKEYLRKIGNHKGLNSTDFALLNYFERFIFSLDATGNLIKELNDNRGMEFPISVILRASMLDVLYVHYIKLKHEDSINSEFSLGNNPALFKDIDLILSNQVQRFLKTYDKLNDKNIISTSEHQLLHNHMIEEFDWLIKRDGNNKSIIEKKPEEIATFDILELFKIMNKDKNYFSIYYLYDYFSKVDHFGAISYKIRNKDKTESFAIFIRAIGFIYECVPFCLNYFKNLKCNDINTEILFIKISEELLSYNDKYENILKTNTENILSFSKKN